ncbi:verprolin-like isoform X2 [Fopius arisanus]|uniref:Verprolin-like isoform X2 n=1 Tax=Fopius arisanus TaxID=64838 RepID=A0A9R1SZZ8_9HYME|nr:PREDICTED: verprolin-like isoform X2 [Fopius arisanus]
MSAPPPPPPPAFNISSAPSTDPQGRNQLLQSIRAGKQLKKTVTVDKSAPAISGKVKNGSSPNSPAAPGFSTSINNTNTNTSSGPMGLGGLFAGGMPKLKPTGLRGAIVDKETSPSPPSNSSSGTIKRGPPPVPPPAAQKPQMIQTESSPELTKMGGFGKPTLAPKPPGQSPAIISGSSTLQKPCPPPKKLDLLRGGGVSRAQSMRLPRSPPVLAPNSSSLHQSQDCLNETHQRPMNRVLRPPVARPPSPPTSRNPSGASNATPVMRTAPPPPSRTCVTAPSMPPPPPPPPHRSNATHQRIAPQPPPTPPTRNLSLSNGQSQSIGNIHDLETRFIDQFHSIATFPSPEQFRGVPKLYNSKNVSMNDSISLNNSLTFIVLSFYSILSAS